MIGRIENFGGIRGFAKCMHPTEDASRTPVVHSVTFRRMFLLPREARDRFKQMDEVGIPSLQAVIVTAIFSGMVFAIQTCTGFKRRGADHFFVDKGKVAADVWDFGKDKEHPDDPPASTIFFKNLILSTGGYDLMNSNVRGGYVGMGLRFEDKDFKYLLGSVPRISMR
jgi:hypothetical protein